jgi:hypothetical protein
MEPPNESGSNSKQLELHATESPRQVRLQREVFQAVKALAIFAPLITIGAAAFLEARYSILQLRLGQQLRLATFHPKYC